MTLFPPSDLPWLRYRRFPCGEFVREGEGFRIRRRGELGEIPWVSVDPLRPEKGEKEDSTPEAVTATASTCSL